MRRFDVDSDGWIPSVEETSGLVDCWGVWHSAMEDRFLLLKE